jgi:hypothetical protein
MGNLGCSLISLTTGAINLPQNNLNITGPGVNSLTVRGAYGDRVLNHTGSGTLTISRLSVVEGYLVNSAGFAVGGCIESSGYLKLVHASVSGCSAVTDTGVAIAGGAYASTGLYLLHSNVTGNVARARTTGFSKGGGGYSRGALFVGDSTIAPNSARASEGSHAAVGGLLIEVCVHKRFHDLRQRLRRIFRRPEILAIRTTPAISLLSQQHDLGQLGGAQQGGIHPTQASRYL